MRRLQISFVFLASAVAAFGQRPVHTAGVITDTTFAGNLAATINGTLPARPVRFPRSPLLGGYGGYPVYSASPAYYPGFDAPVPTVQQVNAPAVVMLTPLPDPQSSKAPEETVRIYSNPVKMADPDVEPLPAVRSLVAKQNSGETIYLIALKDETVATAVAYWTDGQQLKYITPDRKQKQTPVSNVDASLTMRLNEERGVTISTKFE